MSVNDTGAKGEDKELTLSKNKTLFPRGTTTLFPLPNGELKNGSRD